VTAVQLEQMNWLDWSKKAITVVVAGLITLRTFIDQSASEHGVKLKAKNEEHKTEPVSGSGGS